MGKGTKTPEMNRKPPVPVCRYRHGDGSVLAWKHVILQKRRTSWLSYSSWIADSHSKEQKKVKGCHKCSFNVSLCFLYLHVPTNTSMGSLTVKLLYAF